MNGNGEGLSGSPNLAYYIYLFIYLFIYFKQKVLKQVSTALDIIILVMGNHFTIK